MGFPYNFAVKSGSASAGFGSLNVTSIPQYLAAIVPQAAK